MEGNVVTYKARLIAKDFHQIQRVNYEETFSPISMIQSISILLAIALITIMRYDKWMRRQPSSMETSLRMFT